MNGIRQLLAAGVVAVVGTTALAACAVTLDLGGQRFEDDRTETKPVTEIRISGGDGSITVQHGAADGILIHRKVSYRGDRPTARSDRVEGSALILDTDCAKHCSASYTVTVAEDVKVTGRIGTGSIDLRGVTGVDVATSDGSVSVHNASGKVVVKTGTGAVEVRNVAATVEVRTSDGSVTVENAGDVTTETGTGAVELRRVAAANVHTSDGSVKVDGVSGNLAARTGTGQIEGVNVGGAHTTARTADGPINLRLTTVQDVEAQTSTGAITLVVPTTEGGYRVEAHADTGSTKVNIPTSPTGGHQLNLSTQDGSITVDVP
jgi:DUF4097 and DUF4098 domain-containing protein YvlB